MLLINFTIIIIIIIITIIILLIIIIIIIIIIFALVLQGRLNSKRIYGGLWKVSIFDLLH